MCIATESYRLCKKYYLTIALEFLCRFGFKIGGQNGENVRRELAAMEVNATIKVKKKESTRRMENMRNCQNLTKMKGRTKHLMKMLMLSLVKTTKNRPRDRALPLKLNKNLHDTENSRVVKHSRQNSKKLTISRNGEILVLQI